MQILEFLVNEILSVPAFLIGIITAVGLFALRRSVGDVIGAALKAVLGFMLIGAGAGVVSGALEPLGAMINAATGAQGVIPTNEAIAGIAQAEYGSQVAWLLILGFGLSLVIARFTSLRYVFLTGHHALFMATMLTIILATAGYNSVTVILVGAIVLAIMMVSLPALSQRWTRTITGDDSIAMGHFGTLGYVSSACVGSALNKIARPSPSTEDLQLPSGLKFLRDSMVTTALSMALMYVIIAAIALPRLGNTDAFAIFEQEASSVGNYFMQSVTQGLTFGVGVAIILFGVRTVLGELIPAFQGIADKVVPGAIPALDCPIVFPYAQNAVLIGFFASFLGGLLGLAVLSAWLSPAFGVALILPGLVPHFFTGGAAGVYGNATGGRRGAFFGALTNGLIITFLPAFLMSVLGKFSSNTTTFGDADFGWLGLLIGYSTHAGQAVGLILILLIGVGVLGLALLAQKNLAPLAAQETPKVSAARQQHDYPKIPRPHGAPIPPAHIDYE
ncbi:PTS ascorbate transporter subunit IIC [Corynebacterium sp. sy017]|uniref:PTS ascorbate transporter subunit IIC n=1 Tax=unclassified Corynebacterium TaxID=2624378 RepID=UPI001184AA27|nr:MULTISPECIES: PTS ascorbate transporter subunit IIC [unclassified Corynebacterium]MBP3088044.1 PTS ascorbate transporter subunit IIC [Corynebacterium sp. sy017]TSD92572.1 PTS ascorbate transporter subunit IIC [Corynebacterium sp. SY003]